MDEEQNDPEEAEATVLPAREAMSIITSDTTPFAPDVDTQETASDEDSTSSKT